MRHHRLVKLAVAAALILTGSAALAYPVDLQIRSTSTSDSCSAAVFQAELKVVNTSDGPISSSSVYPELAFYAGPTEIEAVYPQLYANIFDASGAYVTWTGATVERSPWTVDSGYWRNRRANQVWRVRFDPPRPNPPNLIPPGGSLIVSVAFRRAGGATPFDLDCDDFTKVEHAASTAFESNQFYHLLFTSTQQLVCEKLDGDANDPLSGLPFTAPFETACR